MMSTSLHDALDVGGEGFVLLQGCPHTLAADLLAQQQTARIYRPALHQWHPRSEWPAPQKAAQHAPATPTPPRWHTLAPGWARLMRSVLACAALDGPAGFGSRPAGQPINGAGVSSAVGRKQYLPDLLCTNPGTSQQMQQHCNQPTSS